MNIKKSKNKKKRRQEREDEDDLSRMRKQYQRTKDREEGTDRDKTRDELKEGSNMRRFLPRKNTREFYLQLWQHFGVGPMSQVVRCIGTFTDKGFPRPDTPCPICKQFLKEQHKNNQKYGRDSEVGKKKYFKIKEKYFPTKRYFMNVLRDDGEVKVLQAGEMIVGQLLEHWFEDGSKVGDFTDVETGRWMNIKRKGVKLKTKYKVIPDDETSEVDDWKAVRKQMHDLEAAAGEILKPAQIKAILEGDFDDEDQDEEEDEEDFDEDDASEEDDEEEDEKDRRSSRKRKRRHARDDDDDDDDDGDDEDDDEDDDDDDDEEDDEDEDEDDDEEDDDEDGGDDDEDEEDDRRMRRKRNKKRRR